VVSVHSGGVSYQHDSSYRTFEVTVIFGEDSGTGEFMIPVTFTLSRTGADAWRSQHVQSYMSVFIVFHLLSHITDSI
jgi:hypothetical protein